MSPTLQVLLPVYNEEESIGRVIHEIWEELSKRIPLEFIVSEDGSTDRTKEILSRLKESLPMKLLMQKGRQGYTHAVVEGMKVADAPHLLFLDSDGQCDPRDFWRFWDARDNYDVLIGERIERRDPFARRILSRGFYFVYQSIFRVPVHDPSCPFVLTHNRVVRVLLPELGEMKEGFWWEFVARAHRRGFSIGEMSIHHRSRFAGRSEIYTLSRAPGIGYRHLTALLKIWKQTEFKP